MKPLSLSRQDSPIKSLVLTPQVRREILDDVTKRSVYPHRLSVSVTGKSDPFLVHGVNVSGVLLVRVLRAQGLPKKGGLRKLVGQAKPDCYAKVRHEAGH